MYLLLNKTYCVCDLEHYLQYNLMYFSYLTFIFYLLYIQIIYVNIIYTFKYNINDNRNVINFFFCFCLLFFISSILIMNCNYYLMFRYYFMLYIKRTLILHAICLYFSFLYIYMKFLTDNFAVINLLYTGRTKI